jgi:hypothetical protein
VLVVVEISRVKVVVMAVLDLSTPPLARVLEALEAAQLVTLVMGAMALGAAPVLVLAVAAPVVAIVAGEV